jgi:hypothetical protein
MVMFHLHISGTYCYSVVMTNRTRSILDRTFKNGSGAITIVQMPNIPLAFWIVLQVSTVVLSRGKLHTGLVSLAMAVLFTWAYMEVFTGVNYFRRFLGCLVMASIVLSYFK